MLVVNEGLCNIAILGLLNLSSEARAESFDRYETQEQLVSDQEKINDCLIFKVPNMCQGTLA